jgi:hypothetical protein
MASRTLPATLRPREAPRKSVLRIATRIFRESERHNREIITLQPQRRDTENHCQLLDYLFSTFAARCTSWNDPPRKLLCRNGALELPRVSTSNTHLASILPNPSVSRLESRYDLSGRAWRIAWSRKARLRGWTLRRAIELGDAGTASQIVSDNSAGATKATARDFRN